MACSTIDDSGPPDLYDDWGLADRVNGHKYLFRVQQDCVNENRGCPTIFSKYFGFIAGKFYRDLLHSTPLDPQSGRINMVVDDILELEDLRPSKSHFDAVDNHLNWNSLRRSPWISTTASWAWAVWDASRRVEKGFTGVEIFVIDASEIPGGVPPNRFSKRRTFYAMELLKRQGSNRQNTHPSNLSQEVLVFASIPPEAVLSRIEVTKREWRSALWVTLSPDGEFQSPLPRYFFPRGEVISPKTALLGYPFREAWAELVASARTYEKEDPLCSHCEGQRAAEQAMFWLGGLWERVFIEAVDSPSTSVNLGRAPHHTGALAEEIAGWIHRRTPVAWQEVQRGIATYLDNLMSDWRLPVESTTDRSSGHSSINDTEDALEEVTEALGDLSISNCA